MPSKGASGQQLAAVLQWMEGSEGRWACAENAVEEGLVGGASTALCAQPFYRLAARQPAALAAVLAALLASGGHRSPKSTAAVGHYALQLIISFIRPPALAAAQVCIG